MRTRAFQLMTKPWVVLGILAIDAILGIAFGNLAYFVSLAFTAIALWASRFKWSEFGLAKPKWGNTIIQGLLYAVGIFVVLDILIQPFIEIYLGEIDLSSFDGIRGSIPNYLIMLAIMWPIAAFGEELIYRGYFMKRIAGLFGEGDKAWYMSAVLVAIGFGIAHMYQGPSGMLATGIAGFLFAWVFIRNKTNLWVAMMTHGFYDVIGITLLYLDKDQIFVEAIRSVIG